MNRIDWKRKAKSFVDIRRDEVRQTFLMFAYNFLIIASYTIIRSARDALFICHEGAGRLPYVYIGLALIAGVVMQGYVRLAQGIKRGHLIMGSNLFFVLNILVFRWLFHYEWRWLSYGFYIWGDIFIGISMAQFWLTASEIFDPRQAKRLFSFILTGGTLGGIVAGGVSRAIVHTIGTENLFLITGLQQLGCAIIIGQITSQESAGKRESEEVGTRLLAPSSPLHESAFALIRRHRHLALLAMIVSVTSLAHILIDFQFKNIVQQSYQSKDDLTSFFGSYYAYIKIVSILFGLLVAGEVLRRFGVGVAIMIMPVALVLGSVATLFHPVLWAAIFIRACEDIFGLSINDSGTQILYIPIPTSIKSKGKTFIDTVVKRMSRGMSGLLLLLLTLGFLGFSWSVNQVSILMLTFLAAWIFLCICVYKEYITSIEATLQKRSLSIDTLDVDLSDSSTIHRLFPLLDSKNERQILYALGLLQDVRNPEFIERVQRLCHHSSPEVKVQALRILFNIGGPQPVPEIETLLEDENDEVRTEAMHYVSVYGEVPSTQRLHSFLTHSDYKMKIAAITCITRYGSDEERVLLTRELIEQMLSETGLHRGSARLGAAKALGVLCDGDPALRDHLLDLFNDEDLDVVKQAISSAGETGCVDFVPYLVEKLGDPTTRVTAREALATYGSAILDTLMVAMADGQSPMSVRRQIPRVIGMIPHQNSVDALLSHLDQDETDMRYKVIKALGKLRAAQVGVQFDTSLVEEYIARGIADYYHLSIILETQMTYGRGLTPPIRLLRQALHERLELFKEMTFRLLGLIHPPLSMYNAYRGVTSRNPRIRANAVELLDNILSRNIKRMLFPIIESSPKTVSMGQASALLGSSKSMTEKEAITALIDGRDDWLKACALHTVGESKMVELQEYVKEACVSSNPLVRESAEFAWRKISPLVY
jgi:AAA family ATP:ADP antiporter